MNEQLQRESHGDSSDLISRQDAIDAIRDLARDHFSVFDESYEFFIDALLKVDSAIKGLPSAQPTNISRTMGKNYD